MILILTFQNQYEQGTEPVVDWLLYYKAKFVRLGIEEFYLNKREVHLDIDTKSLHINNRNVTNDINVVFYRRFFNSFNFSKQTNSPFADQIRSEVTAELIDVANYLFYIFANKAWLPSPRVVNVNKLVMLEKARAAGLSVPRSQIINNKRDLLNFRAECESGILTKPVKKTGYYQVGHHTYISHVSTVEDDTIESLGNMFFPSLFQEKVDKEYEVRVFYLDGEISSVAALVENDSEVDIKRNFDTPEIHWVPYALPKQICKLIDSMMRSFGLNTGSIDLVRTHAGDYVFLEVNPVGQYGAPSMYGNHEIERKIAEWLIKKDR